jgi:quercetin dioxygenase-like cupin family protein
LAGNGLTHYIKTMTDKEAPMENKNAKSGLNPRTIHLDAQGADYLPLLEGPPGTVSMRSGLVVLAPGKSVGLHSTEGFEELVIVLEGQGEMRVTGLEPMVMDAGTAVYCPPETEHNVVNTGIEPLRYVFVVAQTNR